MLNATFIAITIATHFATKKIMDNRKLEYIKKRIDMVNEKLYKPRYTLDQWRREVSLTWEEISEMIGISSTYLRKVRRGKTPPSKKIADGIFNLTHGKVATRSDILG